MNIKTLANILEPFNFKGKARLLHTLSPADGERDDQVFGYKIKLDLVDYIQRSIYLSCFEPEESAWVKNYLKSGMTFVDVGANVGYFTLMAASLVGTNGLVLAFEPSPYAFARLKQTVENNHLSQVRTIQAGLSDSAGVIKLFVPTSLGNHNSSMIKNEGGSPIDVTIQRLEDYLTANDFDHIDLIKIDVEGFEPNVIRGAAKYLQAKKIKAILCEFNKYWLEANNSSPDLLLNEILSYGFKLTYGTFNPQSGLQNLLFCLD
jgi:FkbM family methyltransferase